MQVFSLASVNVSINNKNMGSQLSFGGGGKNIGSVGYGYSNNIFNLETSPDGGATVSFNKSKAGSINITVKQTSPYIYDLQDYIKACWENPQAAAATITIKDATGNIDMIAYDCFPVKIPDNNVGTGPAERDFQFVAAQIDSNERAVQ